MVSRWTEDAFARACSFERDELTAFVRACRDAVDLERAKGTQAESSTAISTSGKA